MKKMIKNTIINKALENKRREELLYEIITSKNQNFIESIEKKSKNENKNSNYKESLHKENHNTKNNYENKKKNETRLKLKQQKNIYL